MSKLKKLPGVLSFNRRIVMTDAPLFSVLADGDEVPLNVFRHGIRGTQNVNGGAKDKVEKNADREVSNVQLTDSAKLHHESETMRAKFGIRYTPLACAMSACADGKGESFADAARDNLARFIARAVESEGLQEVARRFARNIVNGRWLWRNRSEAESVSIQVSSGDQVWTFDATAIPLNTFGDYSADEQAIASIIARSLAGKGSQTLNVVADIEFGMAGGIEVYPSQNFLGAGGKEKGFARSLYVVGKAEHGSHAGIRVMGQAALRDQKVGNALRTIDTWYPAYGEYGIPIPVEPNGASLSLQKHLRLKNASAFNLFLDLDAVDVNSGDGMFCIAALIRGGVYSEAAEKKATETAESTPVAEEEVE